jgi:hypothetical protein
LTAGLYSALLAANVAIRKISLLNFDATMLAVKS